MEYLKKEIQKHKATLNELNNLLINEKNKNNISDIAKKISIESSIIESLLSIDIENKNVEIKKLESKDINLDNETNKNQEKNDNIIKHEKIDIKTGNESKEKKDKAQQKSSKIKNTTNKNNEKKRYKSVNKIKENEELYFSIENINPLVDKKFHYYNKDSDILTEYYKKINKGNFIFFYCSKRRNGCCGAIKYNKEKEKWVIYNECLNNIKHDTYNFDLFYEKFLNEQFNEFNMNYIKFQRYYVQALIKTNQANDISSIKSIFKNKFNIPFLINNNEFTKIKYKVFGSLNNLDLLDICRKISNDDIKININTIDLVYELKKNNIKIDKKAEKVIVLTTDYSEKTFNNKNIENFFIDVTYKVIPKKSQNYKLLTISCYDNNTKSTYISALILIRYEDSISFQKTFKYLNILFDWNPLICHIDYCQALRRALLSDDLFKNKPLIIHCFFHFVQCIIKKMKYYNIIKKRISKYNMEILRNIELISFISPNFINSYKIFLKNKLQNENEVKLYNYLDKNWFEKNLFYYNYFELFDNEKLEEILPHIFITNNIAESLHNKINYYLPNKKITFNNFIIAIRNIFINYEIKNNSLIRKDFVTKTLIAYSKTLKKNKYTWLDYSSFENLQKKIIAKANNTLEDNEINNIINSINNLNMIDDQKQENNVVNSINNSNFNLNENSNDNINDIVIECDLTIDNEDLNNNLKDDESENKDKDEYNISSLFERLLLDEKYIKFREIIEDIKANKKNQKRDLKDSVSEKDLFAALDKKAAGKKKIKYPKK